MATQTVKLRVVNHEHPKTSPVKLDVVENESETIAFKAEVTYETKTIPFKLTQTR